MKGVGLNRWQRIGIVLSVVWALGAAIYEFDTLQRRNDAAFNAAFDPVYNRCRDIQRDIENSQPPNGIDCSIEAWRIANAVPKESAWNVAIASLVPIPIAWLIAYALIGLVRWIRAGFEPST